MKLRTRVTRYITCPGRRPTSARRALYTIHCTSPSHFSRVRKHTMSTHPRRRRGDQRPRGHARSTSEHHPQQLATRCSKSEQRMTSVQRERESARTRPKKQCSTWVAVCREPDRLEGGSPESRVTALPTSKSCAKPLTRPPAGVLRRAEFYILVGHYFLRIHVSRAFWLMRR